MVTIVQGSRGGCVDSGRSCGARETPGLSRAAEVIDGVWAGLAVPTQHECIPRLTFRLTLLLDTSAHITPALL